MRTEEKFLDLCYLISNDTGEKYDFWWEYIDNYEKDSDYEILKSKMINFLNLLNENDDFWMKKDIESEIYNLV